MRVWFGKCLYLVHKKYNEYFLIQYPSYSEDEVDSMYPGFEPKSDQFFLNPTPLQDLNGDAEWRPYVSEKRRVHLFNKNPTVNSLLPTKKHRLLFRYLHAWEHEVPEVVKVMREKHGCSVSNPTMSGLTDLCSQMQALGFDDTTGGDVVSAEEPSPSVTEEVDLGHESYCCGVFLGQLPSEANTNWKKNKYRLYVEKDELPRLGVGMPLYRSSEVPLAEHIGSYGQTRATFEQPPTPRSRQVIGRRVRSGHRARPLPRSTGMSPDGASFAGDEHWFEFLPLDESATEQQRRDYYGSSNYFSLMALEQLFAICWEPRYGYGGPEVVCGFVYKALRILFHLLKCLLTLICRAGKALCGAGRYLCCSPECLGCLCCRPNLLRRLRARNATSDDSPVHSAQPDRGQPNEARLVNGTLRTVQQLRRMESELENDRFGVPGTRQQRFEALLNRIINSLPNSSRDNGGEHQPLSNDTDDSADEGPAQTPSPTVNRTRVPGPGRNRRHRPLTLMFPEFTPDNPNGVTQLDRCMESVCCTNQAVRWVFAIIILINVGMWFNSCGSELNCRTYYVNRELPPWLIARGAELIPEIHHLNDAICAYSAEDTPETGRGDCTSTWNQAVGVLLKQLKGEGDGKPSSSSSSSSNGATFTAYPILNPVVVDKRYDAESVIRVGERTALGLHPFQYISSSEEMFPKKYWDNFPQGGQSPSSSEHPTRVNPHFTPSLINSLQFFPLEYQNSNKCMADLLDTRKFNRGWEILSWKAEFAFGSKNSKFQESEISHLEYSKQARYEVLEHIGFQRIRTRPQAFDKSPLKVEHDNGLGNASLYSFHNVEVLLQWARDVRGDIQKSLENRAEFYSKPPPFYGLNDHFGKTRNSFHYTVALYGTKKHTDPIFEGLIPINLLVAEDYTLGALLQKPLNGSKSIARYVESGFDLQQMIRDSDLTHIGDKIKERLLTKPRLLISKDLVWAIEREVAVSFRDRIDLKKDTPSNADFIFDFKFPLPSSIPEEPTITLQYFRIMFERWVNLHTPKPNPYNFPIDNSGYETVLGYMEAPYPSRSPVSLTGSSYYTSSSNEKSIDLLGLEKGEDVGTTSYKEPVLPDFLSLGVGDRRKPYVWQKWWSKSGFLGKTPAKEVATPAKEVTYSPNPLNDLIELSTSQEIRTLCKETSVAVIERNLLQLSLFMREWSQIDREMLGMLARKGAGGTSEFKTIPTGGWNIIELLDKKEQYQKLYWRKALLTRMMGLKLDNEEPTFGEVMRLMDSITDPKTQKLFLRLCQQASLAITLLLASFKVEVPDHMAPNSDLSSWANRLLGGVDGNYKREGDLYDHLVGTSNKKAHLTDILVRFNEQLRLNIESSDAVTLIYREFKYAESRDKRYKMGNNKKKEDHGDHFYRNPAEEMQAIEHNFIDLIERQEVQYHWLSSIEHKRAYSMLYQIIFHSRNLLESLEIVTQPSKEKGKSFPILTQPLPRGLAPVEPPTSSSSSSSSSSTSSSSDGSKRFLHSHTDDEKKVMKGYLDDLTKARKEAPYRPPPQSPTGCRCFKMITDLVQVTNPEENNLLETGKPIETAQKMGLNMDITTDVLWNPHFVVNPN